MHALNNWMNRIDGWRHSVDANGNPRSFFKKEILSRFGTALVGTPLEIAAVAQNIIAAPITAVGVVAKLGVKTVRCVTSAEFFKKLDNALPSLKDFIRTVLRVFAYAIGAFSTATIGFISPDLNFAAHCKVPFLHLAYNKQQQIDQAAVEVQRQRTAEEELKAHEEQALYDTVAKLIEDQQIEEDKKTEEALTEQVIPVISEQVDQEPVAEPAVEEDIVSEELSPEILEEEEESVALIEEPIDSAEFSEFFEEIDAEAAQQETSSIWQWLGLGGKKVEPAVVEESNEQQEVALSGEKASIA